MSRGEFEVLYMVTNSLVLGSDYHKCAITVHCDGVY